MAEIHFRPVPRTNANPRFYCDVRRTHVGEWTVDGRAVTCPRCLRLLAEIGAAAVVETYPTTEAHLPSEVRRG